MVRPGQIYTQLTKEDFQRFVATRLGRKKITGFRVPIPGEYFMATDEPMEQPNAVISPGRHFTIYKCSTSWMVPTPRFILQFPY